MGKSKSSKVKIKSRNGHFPEGPVSGVAAIVNDVTPMTPSEMLEKAIEYENIFEPSKALHYYNRVIKEAIPSSSNHQDSNDCLIKALEMSAYVLLEMQNDAEAQSRLQRVITLRPDGGHQKYMFLAQLSQGIEAVNLYKAGIGLIKRHKATLSNNPEPINNDKNRQDYYNGPKTIEECLKEESVAYCAIADLFMTDLCDDENAESECASYVEMACQSDPSNAQAWYTAASFHIVKANLQKATECVEKCLELWWPKVQAYLDDHQPDNSKKINVQTEDEEVDNGIDLEELTGIPFASHIGLIRMMMELDMHQKAADILDVMLDEEDDNPELYYLLVEVGKVLDWKSSDPDTLREYAKMCKIMSAKLGDHELVDEMNQLLKDLPPSNDQNDDDFEISSTDSESDAEIAKVDSEKMDQDD